MADTSKDLTMAADDLMQCIEVIRAKHHVTWGEVIIAWHCLEQGLLNELARNEEKEIWKLKQQVLKELKKESQRS